MKRRYWALILALLLLLPLSALAAVAEKDLEGQIHMEVNRTRTGAGLEALRHADVLSEAAGRFARAQAAKDKMEHASTEELKALTSVSYLVGENIAFYSGPDDARMIAAKIVDAWVKSPRHYANMMRPDDTALGLGVAYGASGRVYISLLTGKPFADAETKPSERTAEEGVPGLPYSAVPGDDPLAKRAITGPGYIVYGYNRDLNGAVRLRVDSVKGKSGASTVVMVDADGNVVKAKGLVRVYSKVPANAARPIVMRMDGMTVHFVEVPGTGYIWLTAVL